MINAKRIFIIVFTCLLSLSINNVYAQNHGSLTIHCHYLDVHNHIFNISQDHIALIKIADYDGNDYQVLDKYSKLVTIKKDMSASEQNGVTTKLMDYIKKNNIDYDEELITNQRGEATFRDLDYGIYIIYGQDNPGSKSQGVKQLVAGGGVALIGVTLVPLLSGLLG